MIVDIKYKEQGNGQDSWIIKTYSGTKKIKKDLIKSEIVYKDPNVPLTLQEQIDELKAKLSL